MTSIQTEISRLGSDLSRSFAELIEQLPDRPARAIDIAQSLKISRNVAHRLFTAVRADDPLESAHLIPGPGPLRRMIDTASQVGVSAEVTRAAEDATTQFEQLIERISGDRGGLDSIIAEWLPEARQRYESTSRQLVYRGMRHVKGVSAAMQFNTMLVHPADDRNLLDLLFLEGHIGLERVRPSGRMRVAVRTWGEQPPTAIGSDDVPDSAGSILTEYCSEPKPTFDVVHASNRVVYILRWDEALGRESSRDMVMCEMRRRAYPRRWDGQSPRRRAMVVSPAVPCKHMMIDLLLHKSVWPGVTPMFRMLSTGLAGGAHPEDSSRDVDEFDTPINITLVKGGIAQSRISGLSFYPQMLNDVCGRLGWDPEAFTIHRVRLDYPICDTQLQYVIQLPEQA